MTVSDAAAIDAMVTTNEYYRSAIECPEYTQAVELRAAARKMLTALPGQPAPLQRPQAPGDIEQWLLELAAAESARQAHQTKYDALVGLINGCDNTILVAANMAPSRLLRSLNADLDSLMLDVAAVVGRLAGAETPKGAIASGAADVWGELITLRTAYDKIRSAQAAATPPQAIVDAQSQYLDDPLASDIAIANLDLVFADWRRPNRNHVVLTGTTPDPRPWPQDDIEQLVWLSTSDAQVWVPTTEQLDELRTQRHRAANPNPKVRRERPDLLNHDFGAPFAQRSKPVRSTPMPRSGTRR